MSFEFLQETEELQEQQKEQEFLEQEESEDSSEPIEEKYGIDTSDPEAHDFESFEEGLSSSNVGESEEEQEEETPVLNEYEALETAPHFKVEYPKSPEIIYSKELETMSLFQLNNDMYYIKSALNSIHSSSKIAVEALRREMDLRDRFLLELYIQSEEIKNIDDEEIKSIR